MNTTDILDNSVIATRLGAVKRRLTAAISHSSLYRWLTAEPEPEVIVIDLRETYTIGPILRLLDRFGAWLAPIVAASQLARGSRWLSRVFRDRPVQLVSSLIAALTAMLLLFTTLTDSVSPLVSVALLVIFGLTLLGTRVTWSLESLRDTRGYRLLATAFEPPTPPENRETSGTDSDAPVEESDATDK